MLSSGVGSHHLRAAGTFRAAALTQNGAASPARRPHDAGASWLTCDLSRLDPGAPGSGPRAWAAFRAADAAPWPHGDNRQKTGSANRKKLTDHGNRKRRLEFCK